MAKKSIKSVFIVHRNEKTEISPDKPIKYLEVRISDKKSFDIEIDEEGDLVITGSHNIKILADDENQIIFKMKG